MPLDPTLRDQLAKTIHDAACACGGRTHHRHYLTAADKATELLTTQPAPIVLPTAKEVREAIIAGTKLGGWMPHTAAQAILDLIAARLPVWQPVEPGTVIKAGTVHRLEWAHKLGEVTAVERTNAHDITIGPTDPARYYVDPRTVPAEPEDPCVELVAEELHNHGGCEETWPRCSVSTVENYRNDARDLLARIDAARADS